MSEPYERSRRLTARVSLRSVHSGSHSGSPCDGFPERASGSGPPPLTAGAGFACLNTALVLPDTG